LIWCNVYHYQPIETNIVIYLYLAYFDLNICLLFLMNLNLIKHLKFKINLTTLIITLVFHDLIMITLICMIYDYFGLGYFNFFPVYFS